MERLNVMVIDDDLYVRQALEALLSRHPQTTPYAVVSDIDKGKSVLETEKALPDVIILDNNFEGQEKTGTERISEIREVAGDTKIVVCSMHQDKETVLRAIKAGADGFIWKNESGDGIISAVIKLCEGRFVVTKSIAEMIMGQAVSLDKYVEILQDQKNYKQLTEELRKTMYLYCYCGMSAKEIAEELNLSFHTVNSRIKTAYQLLHVTSKAEAFSKLVEREES